MKWFFNVGDDGVIEMRARAEGEGGMVGDAFGQLRPGENLYGVPYEVMRAAGAGVVEVDEQGRGRLVKPRPRR